MKVKIQHACQNQGVGIFPRLSILAKYKLSLLVLMLLNINKVEIEFCGSFRDIIMRNEFNI